MKYLYMLMFAALSFSAKAHTYTTVNDTIDLIPAPLSGLYYDTIVIGSAPVTFQWKVIACNFPPDWMSSSVSGFCDNALCRTLASLWPSGGMNMTASYAAGDTGVLDLVLDLTTVTSSGCYFVTTRLYNSALTSDSTTETWTICFHSLGTQILRGEHKMVLYPNPVSDELAINFDATLGSCHATIYDMTGRVVVNQNVSVGTATLNTTSIAAGVYMVSLYTDAGALVAHQKFVKN